MNVALRDLQTLFEVGSLGGLPDGQLLDRFVARREGAVFEAIIHRHGPMVWGVCRRVLRDHHDAEDAFQATFLVLARKASSVMPREKLGNWLYGVAYQTALKARAMRTKRRGRESQVSDMPEPRVVPDDLRYALAESLDRELSRLPEKYRIPVVLCDLEGNTHREAASQLGWPVGTVSSRLSRARAMLAKRLSRRGVSLSAGSLAVLLVQGAASASVPTRLIGSTAQAASLFAAGGATTAGVVSAKVATLTGEVMKMMLLSKIKVATLLLLVLTGTGLIWNGSGAAGAGQDPAPRRSDTATEGEPKQEPGGPKLPMTELEGTWVLVSTERRGKLETVEKDGPVSAAITFRGDRCEMRQQKATSGSLEVFADTSRFIVDAHDNHKAFTTIPRSGKRNEILLALYKVEDGMLKVCCTPGGSGDRPQSFDSNENRQIETYKRGEISSIEQGKVVSRPVTETPKRYTIQRPVYQTPGGK